MAYRSNRSDFSDRDRDYTPGPPRRPPPREVDDFDLAYERRESRAPPRRAPVREYEDIDIQVRDRERERDNRTPAFLREDNRKTEAGPLVLRSREVETVDRRRPRSPSPIRYRERFVERDRERAPSVPPERRPRFIERSPSPAPPPAAVRVESRIIERRRERSPSPERERDMIHLRIEREKEKQRAPSPSPSPPPPQPPPVIRGPTIEREVITHYRDIDHGESTDVAEPLILRQVCLTCHQESCARNLPHHHRPRVLHPLRSESGTWISTSTSAAMRPISTSANGRGLGPGHASALAPHAYGLRPTMTRTT